MALARGPSSSGWCIVSEQVVELAQRDGAAPRPLSFGAGQAPHFLSAKLRLQDHFGRTCVENEIFWLNPKELSDRTDASCVGSSKSPLKLERLIACKRG